jgi:hypothetical protein
MRLIWLISLIMLSGVGIAQDTIQRVFLGTKGEDEFVNAYERENDFLILGSVDNGENLSDISLIRIQKDLTSPIYKRMGTSSIERLCDSYLDTSSNSIYLYASYFNGFESSSYNSKLYKVSDDLSISLEKNFITESQDVPLFLRVQSDSVFLVWKSTDIYNLTILDTNFNMLDELVLDFNYDEFDLKDISIEQGYICLLGDYKSNSLGRQLLFQRRNFSTQVISEWEYGDSLDEMASKMTLSDTFLLIAGSSQSLNGHPDFDAIIIKTDYSGNIIWERDHGFAGAGPYEDDYCVRSALLASGDILFGVNTRTYGEGNVDYHLYLLSPSGYYKSGNSYGYAFEDKLKSFFMAEGGRKVLFGESFSGSIGVKDILVVATDTVAPGGVKVTQNFPDTSTVQVLSVQNAELKSDQDFVVSYHETLNISGLSPQLTTQVMVFNIKGEVLVDYNSIFQDSCELDLRKYSSQILILQIQDLNRTQVIKILSRK